MRRSPYTLTLVTALTLCAAPAVRPNSADSAPADASRVHLEPPPGPEFSTACRMRTDSVDVILDGPRVIFSIDSVRGRGTATVTRKDPRWPDEVVVRLNVGSLESLKLSSGGETAEDPPAKAFDADGKSVDGSPGPGGHFDVTVPRTLLVGNDDRTLVIVWSDVVWHR